MAKHVIFLLHGMGKHEAGWSRDAQAVLKKAYDSFPSLQETPFEKYFEFHELIYDQFFEGLRGRWRTESKTVLGQLGASGVDDRLLSKLAELGASSDEDNFFNTHLLDVVLYALTSLVRIPIRTNLAVEQIPGKLKGADAGGEVKEWSIICHSLGTIVGHDALHAMFNPINATRPDPKNRGPIAGLFVANVSRLLQNDFDVYTSMVRPSVKKATGIFHFYLNANHQLDPFPKPRAFKPPHEWLDPETRNAAYPRFHDIEIKEVAQVNVHALEHYLANPRVHVEFFRALWRDKSVISDADKQKAVRDFSDKLPTSAKLEGLKRQMQALIERQGQGIGDFLEIGKLFNDLLRL